MLGTSREDDYDDMYTGDGAGNGGTGHAVLRGEQRANCWQREHVFGVWRHSIGAQHMYQQQNVGNCCMSCALRLTEFCRDLV